jgi:hypothetical protein
VALTPRQLKHVRTAVKNASQELYESAVAVSSEFWGRLLPNELDDPEAYMHALRHYLRVRQEFVERALGSGGLAAIFELLKNASTESHRLTDDELAVAFTSAGNETDEIHFGDAVVNFDETSVHWTSEPLFSPLFGYPNPLIRVLRQKLYLAHVAD